MKYSFELSYYLFKKGFKLTDFDEGTIDYESLTEIREFIRAHFEKSPKIQIRGNKSSFEIWVLLQLCIPIKFKEVDFIEAMTL